MGTAEKWLKSVLAVIGALAGMGIVAAVMPQSWLVWCIDKVEPDLPVSLLVSYLARALSAMFFIQGMLCFVFAADVKRYRFPISLMAISSLLVVVGIGIHIVLYLPYISKRWFFWFIAADMTLGTLINVTILVLQSKIRT